MSSKMMVFTGNANPALARKVADRLYLAMGNAAVSKFSDGEITVELNENVRGKDVFVLQSTCHPTNDNIIELLLMIDALRRASAGRITAVVPYFGYARQDRRVRSARVPISAKVVGDTMVGCGRRPRTHRRPARRADSGLLYRAGRQRLRLPDSQRRYCCAAITRT